MAEWSYANLDEHYKKNFKWQEIVAKKNDTVEGIYAKAKAENPLCLTLQEIKQLNNIPSSKVSEGVKVKVYAKYIYEELLSSDSYSKVILAFSITYEEFLEANPSIKAKIKEADEKAWYAKIFSGSVKPEDGDVINLPSKRLPTESFVSISSEQYVSEEFNRFIAEEGSRTYEGTPPVNNLNVPPLDYYNDIFPEHRKMNSKYKLRIGDCMFFIPPEFIQVNKQANANEFPLLRQKGTMKTHNGFAMTRIEITLWFTELEQINGFKVQSPNGKDNPYHMDGLRPLIAQFKRTPFLPVENELLNNMFDIHAVAFVNLSFSTIQQLPGTLQASLILYKMEMMPIIERPSWMYNKMILYPLFRSYYQQSLIKENSYSSTYLEEVESTNFTDSFKFSLLDESALKDLNSGNTKITIKALDEAIQSYNEVKLPDDIYCVSITSSIGSIITPITMTGYENPTFQYMGAGDTSFVIKFETMNRTAATDLYAMYERCLYYSRNYRNRIVSGYVKVENTIINMCGVKYLMIVDMTVSTVPEYPGLYMISMTATSHEANQQSFERLKGFNGINQTQASKILEHNLDIINYLTKDVKDKDRTYIVEELNAEAIIDTLELYPDLALPKYSMVHDEIQKINKFRKSLGLKQMPIDRYVPPSIRYKYWDETIERYKLNSMEHYVDPDFYMIYPDLDFFKEDIDLGTLYDYEQATTFTDELKANKSVKQEDIDNAFSESVDSISDVPITGLSFTERVVETNLGVLFTAEQYSKHPNPYVKAKVTALKTASSYNQYFIEMGKKYGIDEKMLIVTSVFESSGNPMEVGVNLREKSKITGLQRIDSLDCGLMQISVKLSAEDEKIFFEAFKKSPSGSSFLNSKKSDQTQTRYVSAIKQFILDDSIKKGYSSGLSWLKGKIHAATDSTDKSKIIGSIYDLITNPKLSIRFAANLYIEKRATVRRHFNGFIGYNDYFEIRATFIYYMRGAPAEHKSKAYPQFRDIWDSQNHPDKEFRKRIVWGDNRFNLWKGLQVTFKDSSTNKTQGVKEYYVPKASVEKMTIEKELSEPIDILVPIPEDQTKDVFSGNYKNLTKKFIKNTMRNESRKYSRKGRLVRAFPTYCLVFVDEGITIDYRRIWNNYYAYHALQDISVVKERENPVDTAYIKLSNVYGALDFIDKELIYASKKLYKIGTNIDNMSNFIAKNANANNTQAILEAQGIEQMNILSEDGEIKTELLSEFYRVVTAEKKENKSSTGIGELFSQYWNAWFPQITKDVAEFRLKQISSFGIMLKVGARVHLRLGYGSIGSKMPIVFNGTITEMTEGDILDIICQSDGMELLNRPVADEPDSVVNWYSFDQEPREVLEAIMSDTTGNLLGSIETGFLPVDSTIANLYNDSAYGIKHFGQYRRKSILETLDPTRDSGLDTFDVTKNIYVSTGDAVINPTRAAEDERNFYYYINEKKPWDMFKFFESCVPEFETKIFEHGFHSTIFFGKPHWYVRTKYYATQDRRDSTFFEAIRIAQQVHEYDSISDIISNNIKTTHGNFCTIVIPTYKYGAFDSVEAINPIYLDRNIKTEYQKTEFIDTSHLQDYVGPEVLWDGIGGALAGAKEAIDSVQNWVEKISGDKEEKTETREGPSAKKFATYSGITHMRHSLRNMYEGELNVIGDSAVRPGDIFTMNDTYTLISGPAEVGRVIHHFSLQTGFITSIKPDLISVLAKPEDGELSADGYVNYNVRKSILIYISEIALNSLFILIRKKAAAKLKNKIKTIADEVEEIEVDELDKDGKPVFDLDVDGKPKLDADGNPIIKKIMQTRQKNWMTSNLVKEITLARDFIRTGRYSALIGSSPVLATNIFGAVVFIAEIALFAVIDYYMTSLIESFIHRDAGIKIFPLFQRGKPYVGGISGHKNLIPGYEDESNLDASNPITSNNTSTNQQTDQKNNSQSYDKKPLGKAIVNFPDTIKYAFPIESNNAALSIKTSYFKEVSEDFRFGLVQESFNTSFALGGFARRYISPGVELNFIGTRGEPQNVFSIANAKVIHIFDKEKTNTSSLNLLNFNKKSMYNDYGIIMEINNESKLNLKDDGWGFEIIGLENHILATKKMGLTVYPDADVYLNEELPDEDETQKIYVIYFGLSKIIVNQGEEIKVGQIIGEFTADKKLYIEMQDKNNVPFDPIYFLKQVGARVIPFNPNYKFIKE